MEFIKKLAALSILACCFSRILSMEKKVAEITLTVTASYAAKLQKLAELRKLAERLAPIFQLSVESMMRYLKDREDNPEFYKDSTGEG